MASILTVRRVALPLIVLMIAGAISWWNHHRNEQATAQIHSYLLQLCEDLQAGRELKGTIQPLDSFSERQLIEQLRRACGSATIAISRGDVEHAGSADTAAESATHTALFAHDGREVLGLRLHFVPGTTTTQILGYWLPSQSP